MIAGSQMSYERAVRLLTGETKALDGLGDLFNLGMLAGGIVNPGIFLAWFDASTTAVPLLKKAVAGVHKKIDGTNKASRDEVINASHGVIVALSQVEAIAEILDRHCSAHKWRASVSDWVARENTGKSRIDKKLSATTEASCIIDWGLFEMVGPPTPIRSFLSVEADVAESAESMGHRFLRFLRGLSVWDTLDETQQDRIYADFARVDALAVRRYRENFLRLASDVQEFFVWAELTSAEHIQLMLSEQREALHQFEPMVLARLDNIVGILEDHSPALQALSELPHVHDPRKVRTQILDQLLRKPLIVVPDFDMPAHLTIPTLEEGYVEPRFQFAKIGQSDEGRVADESWWAGTAPRRGLGSTLYGLIESPDSSNHPILILGDPGAGKSLLSQLLTARLEPERSFALRIEMRTANSTDVLDMLDDACRHKTNGKHDWRGVCESMEDRQKVVILDGFDELIQNYQSDDVSGFLLHLDGFLQREAAMGEPVTMITTCRTSSLRALRLPEMSLAIRLLPFADDEVELWVDNWNKINLPYFTSLGAQSLATRDLGTIARFGLPLLLVLAAILLAESPDSTGPFTDLPEAAAFDGLVNAFLRREYKKLAKRDEDEAQYVAEMRAALESIALFMFANGVKIFDEQRLNEVHKLGKALPRGGSDAAIVKLERAVERFYFVYSSQSSIAGSKRQSIEFLHATMGESLVASTFRRVLEDVIKESGGRSAPRTKNPAISLLSSRSLLSEPKVLEYIVQLLDSSPKCDLIVQWLVQVGWVSTGSHPLIPAKDLLEGVRATARLSINVVVLAASLAGDNILLSHDSGWGQDRWSALVSLWRAGLPQHEYEEVLRGLHSEITKYGIWVRLGIDPRWEALSRAVPGPVGPGVENEELYSELAGNASLAVVLRGWRGGMTDVSSAVRHHTERGIGPGAPESTRSHLRVLDCVEAVRIGGAKTLTGFPLELKDVLESLQAPSGPESVDAASMVLDMQNWEDALLLGIVRAAASSPLPLRSGSAFATELYRRGLIDDIRDVIDAVSRVMMATPKREQWFDYAQIVALARTLDVPEQIKMRLFRCLPLIGVIPEFALLLGRDSIVWLYGRVPKRHQDVWS